MPCWKALQETPKFHLKLEHMNMWASQECSVWNSGKTNERNEEIRLRSSPFCHLMSSFIFVHMYLYSSVVWKFFPVLSLDITIIYKEIASLFPSWKVVRFAQDYPYPIVKSSHDERINSLYLEGKGWISFFEWNWYLFLVSTGFVNLIHLQPMYLPG